jgi:hypothetical protein
MRESMNGFRPEFYARHQPGRRILRGPSTLFAKMRYDFPNFPPHYPLLHRGFPLNFVHAAFISQLHPAAMRQVQAGPVSRPNALIF